MTARLTRQGENDPCHNYALTLQPCAGQSWCLNAAGHCPQKKGKIQTEPVPFVRAMNPWLPEKFTGFLPTKGKHGAAG